MRREYHHWWSPHLERNMELLAFGHSGARVIVFPTRVGRFYDYENFGLVHSLRSSIEAGKLQLFCLDSIDAESFYCNWAHPRGRIERHQKYEHYVLNEVLPFTEECNPEPFLISHGCSFGAYHAANIAFRNPEKFNKVVALSGRYDITEQVESFRNLMDGYYDDDVYFHNPAHFLPNLSDEKQLQAIREMDITFAIGEHDPFIENNRFVSGILWAKGAWNALNIWSGRAHKARYWRQMVPVYL